MSVFLISSGTFHYSCQLAFLGLPYFLFGVYFLLFGACSVTRFTGFSLIDGTSGPGVAGGPLPLQDLLSAYSRQEHPLPLDFRVCDDRRGVCLGGGSREWIDFGDCLVRLGEAQTYIMRSYSVADKKGTIRINEAGHERSWLNGRLFRIPTEVADGLGGELDGWALALAMTLGKIFVGHGRDRGRSMGSWRLCWQREARRSIRGMKMYTVSG